ncbi:MAG TPA: hypothetical protein VG961_13935 [Ignavibacteria bacterium]|nr:hypothetical protein [Ignavibacteria bacterium]
MEHTHKNIFIDELSTHWKFTAGAVVISGLIIAALKLTIFPKAAPETEHLFEGFFIAHLFFASLTPASLLAKYKKALWLGVFVAILTSSITCTLSDIVLPYLGGLALGYDMHFHVCIIEEPITAWTFIISGALLGFLLSQSVRKLSRYTHGLHIFLSSTAAGMYLITYGVEVISLKALIFLPILVISVLVPCVMNDIGVPSYIVSMNAGTKANKRELLDEIHHEHHDHHH